MGNKNQLVVVPNGAWELKIPKWYTDALKNMFWISVNIIVSPGFDRLHLKDPRKESPSIIVLPSGIGWDIERKYVRTFAWNEADLPWILWHKIPRNITPEWYMKLPQSALDLFQKDNTRARIILLSEDAFAVSFQDRFPGKK